MINYEQIVEDFVEHKSISAYTTIKYKQKWYSIDIKVSHLPEFDKDP